MAGADGIIDQVMAYASTLIAESQKAAIAAQSAINVSGAQTVLDQIVNRDIPYSDVMLADPGGRPTDPELQNTPDAPGVDTSAVTISDVDVPPPFSSFEHLAVTPDFTSIARPVPFSGTLTTSAPTLSEVVMPDAPTFSVPAMPTLALDASAPEFGAEYLAPTEAAVPVPEWLTFTESFTFSEDPYESRLLDALEEKLHADLTGGGYGLDEADAARVFDQARDREMETLQSALDETARLTAARGFRVPPGALHAQQASAVRMTHTKLASLSREVMTTKAALYAEHRKFTISAAQSVSDMLIRMTMSVAERALNAAKSRVELSLAISNSEIAKYNARLDGIRVALAARESYLATLRQNADTYRTALAAEMSKLEIDKTKVDVYKAQLQGTEMLVRFYESQINAARAQVDLDRARMDAYKAEVEAFVAQVSAKNSEFSAYETAVRAEGVKAGTVETAARVYGTTVNAYRSRVQAERDRASVAESRAKLLLEEWKAAADAVGERNRFAINKAEIELKGYESAVSFGRAKADIELSRVRTNADIANKEINTSLAKAQLAAQILENETKAFVTAIMSRGEMNGRLASGLAQAAGQWSSAIAGITANIETN